MNDNKRVVKFLGGAVIDGVPARDLTTDEYEKHKERIEECPTVLYELPKKATKNSSKDSE